MALITMLVCNEHGYDRIFNIGTPKSEDLTQYIVKSESIVGNIIPFQNSTANIDPLYAFYARETLVDTDPQAIKSGEQAPFLYYPKLNGSTLVEAQGDGSYGDENFEDIRKFKKIEDSVYTVNIVIPAGGAESGLFRFPRVGEKVLVHLGGGTDNYLLGYVPDSTNNNTFVPQLAATDKQTAENNKLQADKGLILRYQQTGKNSPGPDEQYSEIGFYSKLTSWEPSVADNYNETVMLDKDGKETTDEAKKDKQVPKIDRINIKSTGDIYSDAVNYQGIRANRMEISVGKDKNLGKKAKRGVLSLEAGDEIQITSDTKITLKVGKSSITIDDTGISMSTNKVTGPYGTAWETKLNLSPADGIMGGGTRIKFSAVNQAALEDSYGGSLSANMGITRIGGLDIKMETESMESYTRKFVGNLLSDLIPNITLLGLGIAAEAKGRIKDEQEIANIFSPSLQASGALAKTFASQQFSWGKGLGIKETGYNDNIGALQGAFMIAHLIISSTATILSFTVSKWKIVQDAQNEEAKAAAANLARSSINLAMAIADATLSTVFGGILTGYCAEKAVENGASPVHKSTVHLQAGGRLNEDTFTKKITIADEKEYKTPLAGYKLPGFNKAPFLELVLKLSKPLMTYFQKAGYFDNKELENL